jgi:hypothetical protein
VSTLRQLRGDDVAARDGVIGALDDLVFDDEQWAVYALAVDTGSPRGRVLIPPQAVEPGLSGARKTAARPDARATQRRAHRAPLKPRR